MLQEIGEEGQRQLLQSRIVVIGAGGLGSSVLQYLSAAGVGFIRIVDDDVVSLHNLQRQVLFDEDSIGLSKAEVASKRLSRLNADIEIEAVPKRLTKENALSCLKGMHLMIDCTDNILTRRIMDEAANILNLPWIHASIGGWQGHCTILNSGPDPVHYSDLMPLSDEDDAIQPPAVLGALPGILGAIEASEAVKFLIHMPPSDLLIHKLFWIDLKSMKSRVWGI